MIILFIFHYCISILGKKLHAGGVEAFFFFLVKISAGDMTI